jgi:hypothetical protein
MPSPFLPGNPLPPHLHLGRTRPLARILDRLSTHGQSTAILGDPRTGKTSLLDLVAASRDSLRHADSAHLILSPLDSHTLDRGITVADFWDLALAPLEAPGSPLPADSPAISALHAWRTTGSSPRRLPQLLAALRAASARLVLLVDEFDHLVRNCVTDPRSFFGILRAAATTSGALALVVATRTPLADLDEFAQQNGYSGSPYFNFMTEETLGPLTPDETTTLLSRAAGRFTVADQALIRTLAAGHPYLLQLVADILYRALEDASPDPHVETADRALREASRTLANLWRHWPAPQRFVLASVALGVRTSITRFREPVDMSLAQGYLRSNGTDLHVAPELLAMWILRHFAAHAGSESRWRDWLGPEEHPISLQRADREAWVHAARTRLASPSTPPPSLAPATPPAAGRRARLFISYAPADDSHRDRLDKHLATLRGKDLIELWHDHRIRPGDDRDAEYAAALRSADLIILLISADFLDASFTAGADLQHAIDRHRDRTVHVIPIAVRAADWGDHPIAQLQALPRNGRPVAQWPDHDDAWAEVAAEIRRIVTSRAR